MLADECQSSPSHSSSAPSPASGRQSPQWREWRVVVMVQPLPVSCSLRFSVRGGVGSMWVAVHSTCPHPGLPWPPGCLSGERRCRVSLALRTLRAGKGEGRRCVPGSPSSGRQQMSSSPESHWAGTMGTRPFTVQPSLCGQGGRVGACAAHVPSALRQGACVLLTPFKGKKWGWGTEKKENPTAKTLYKKIPPS